MPLSLLAAKLRDSTVGVKTELKYDGTRSVVSMYKKQDAALGSAGLNWPFWMDSKFKPPLKEPEPVLPPGHNN